MTTDKSFLNHHDHHLQSRFLHRPVSSSLRSLPHCLVLLFLTGCGGGDDDFGPTVIRSASKNENVPVVPSANPAAAARNDANTNQSGRTQSPADERVAATPEPASHQKPASQTDASGPLSDETATNATIDKSLTDRSGEKLRPQVDRLPVAGAFVRSSSNGAIFAGPDRRELIVFDQYTGQEITRFRHSASSRITTLATNPDATLIVTGMANGTVQAFRSLDTNGFDVHARRMAETAQQTDTGTQGHDGIVTHVVLFRDNQRLATAGSDGRICIWELSTGTFQESSLSLVREFQAHTAEVLALSSLNDERLMSVGADGVVRFWSLTENEPVPEEIASIGPSVSAVSISSDESLLVVALEDGRVQLISLDESRDAPASGEPPVGDASDPATADTSVKEPEIAHPSKVRCVALSENSSILMTGCDDGVVRLWDVATHKELERTPAYGAEIVAIGFPTSTAGRQFVRSIVALDASGRLQWWPSAANPNETRRTRILTRPVSQFRLTAFEPGSSSEELAQTAASSGEELERQRLEDQLRMSASQEQLASNRKALLEIHRQPDVRPASDESPSLIASFSTTFNFRQAGNSRTEADSVALDFSVDSSQLAIGRKEPSSGRQQKSTVCFRDIPTGTELRRWEQIPSELKRLHVVGHGQNIITLPSAHALRASAGLTSELTHDAVLVARSPDGRHVVTGEQGTQQTKSPVLRLLDGKTLNEIATFESYESYPTALAFSPDGKTVVAGIRERKAHRLIAFEASTLQQKQVMEEHDHDQPWLISGRVGGTRAITQILFSADGRRMLTSGEYGRSHFRVALWSIRNDTWSEESDRRAESRVALMKSDIETPARFLNERGSRIILARESGYQILDLDDKRIEREIKLPASAAGTRPVSIAPDGSLLAHGTEQGKVQIWQLNKENPMLEFKAHLGPLVGLRFSPDSTLLATVGEENVVSVWSPGEWVNQPRKLVRN